MSTSSELEAPFESAEDRLVLWQRATPRGEQHEEQAAFCRKVRTRMEVAGGDLLGSSGGSIGASFDAMELPDVIELALGIAQDAAAEMDALDVACGIAYGPVVGVSVARSSQLAAPLAIVQGAAIDRAQLIAHRAEAGETVLDEATAQQADPVYLFVRELRAGSFLGRVLDPRYDKRACREAVQLVVDAGWPSVPVPSIDALLRSLNAPRPRVLLASPSSYGALDHIAQARAELAPPLVLHAARDGAGLAPLSSLGVALRRAWRSIEALPLSAPAREVLQEICAGRSVGRTEAGAALSALLGVFEAPTRPWIVLERARELDSPSLLVVSDLLGDPNVSCALIATSDETTQLPSSLIRNGAPELIQVDALDEAARRETAARMLALPPHDEVVQRIADLGGDSVLALREAACALISTGDVVHDGMSFRFRVPDRRSSGTASVEELVLARASGLPNVAHRVLEAVCIAPIACAHDFARAIVELDGLPAEASLAGFDQLQREGFLDEHGGLGPLETTVRFAVRAAMPPARASELHRFVARVLRDARGEDVTPAFIDADIAHHLAEGGNESAAARALLDGAAAAHANGFDRVAVRLAALARKLDSSSDVRDRAAQLAQVVGTRAETDPLRDTAPGQGEAASSAPRPSSAAVHAAVRAILERDSESAESALDTAVTMGLGRAAAGRLSAIAQLARGDIPEAVRALKRARSSGGQINATKQSLTAALILLEAGNEVDAVRSALEALATSRRNGEPDGERASLLVLGGCYRRLGRFEDADRIETRA